MWKPRLVSFVVAFLAGVAIWATSRPLTGQSEPWDAAPLYYPAAIIVAGFLVGVCVPRSIVVPYFGIVAGQITYMVIVLPPSPFALLGLIYVCMYAAFAVPATLVGTLLRRNRPPARSE